MRTSLGIKFSWPFLLRPRLPPPASRTQVRNSNQLVPTFDLKLECKCMRLKMKSKLRGKRQAPEFGVEHQSRFKMLRIWRETESGGGRGRESKRVNFSRNPRASQNSISNGRRLKSAIEAASSDCPFRRRGRHRGCPRLAPCIWLSCRPETRSSLCLAVARFLWPLQAAKVKLRVSLKSDCSRLWLKDIMSKPSTATWLVRSN